MTVASDAAARADEVLAQVDLLDEDARAQFTAVLTSAAVPPPAGSASLLQRASGGPIRRSRVGGHIRRLDMPFTGTVDVPFQIKEEREVPNGLRSWYTYIITANGRKHEVQEWQISSSPHFERASDRWKRRKLKKQLELFEYPDVVPPSNPRQAVCCTRCDKWREIVSSMSAAKVLADDQWHCALHPDLNRAHPFALCCEVPEEDWDPEEWAGWDVESESGGGESGGENGDGVEARHSATLESPESPVMPPAPPVPLMPPVLTVLPVPPHSPATEAELAVGTTPAAVQLSPADERHAAVAAEKKEDMAPPVSTAKAAANRIVIHLTEDDGDVPSDDVLMAEMAEEPGTPFAELAATETSLWDALRHWEQTAAARA